MSNVLRVYGKHIQSFLHFNICNIIYKIVLCSEHKYINSLMLLHMIESFIIFRNVVKSPVYSVYEPEFSWNITIGDNPSCPGEGDVYS